MASQRVPQQDDILMQVDAQAPVMDANQYCLQPSVLRLQQRPGILPKKLKFQPQSYDIRNTGQLSSKESETSSNSNQRSHSAYQQIKFLSKNQRHVSGSGQIDRPFDKVQMTKKPRKRRRPNDGNAETRLTVIRPVNNASAIHTDAWRLILSFSTPKTLLKMRYVSPMFYNLLKEGNIWKVSRERYFGASIPACPYFLSEQEYVNLIEGSGCQRRGCLRRDTRKTYWTFGVRFCEDCMFAKTSKDPPAAVKTPQSLCADLFSRDEVGAQFGDSILDLIPTGVMVNGKYHSARPVDRCRNKWLTNEGKTSLVYLKSDLNRLMHDFQAIQNEPHSPEEILSWTRDRYNDATKHCKAVVGFDNPDVFVRDNDEIERLTLLEKREDFFQHRAMALDRRLTPSVLLCMSAYYAAVITPNKPSERAWDLLRPKLLPYCEEAVQVRDFKVKQLDLEIDMEMHRWPESAIVYKQLHDRRSVPRKDIGKYPVEQKFVLDLARDVFNSIKNHTAEEDLVLLCLRTVHDRYDRLSSKPHGLNFDGVEGQYRLSLDDARLIVEEVIQPEFDTKTLRFVKIFEEFKCAGCTRNMLGRRWSFRQGFEHIFKKHAAIVGKDLHFSRYAKNFIRPMGPQDCNLMLRRGWWNRSSEFPWYLAEWTKTLPLLPSHIEVNSSTKWLPDSIEPYVQLAGSGPASAFSDRTARGRDGIIGGNFMDNFTYAAGLLASTTLDRISISKIALRYSLALSDDPPSDEVELDTFLDGLKAAEKNTSFLAFRAKCGACCAKLDSSRRIQCAKTAVRIDKLQKHWYSTHAKHDGDWKREFINWPSDTALLDIMLRQDEQLKSDQARSMKRETISIHKTLRKLPDQKAVTLMGKRMVMEVFDILFSRNIIDAEE